MKKIILIGLILVLFVSVTAIMLNNKEEAMAYFRNYKAQRESDISEVVTTITYTTNKECIIHYKLEIPLCRVCVKYDINDETRHICLSVNKELTEKDIDSKVKSKVRDKLKSEYPIEEVRYDEFNIIGKKLVLGTEN